MGSEIGYGVGVALRATAAPLVLGMRWLRHRTSEETAEVPRPDWSVGLFSKVALDDAFFVSELALASLVSFANRARLGREIADSIALYEGRGWLQEPREYHQTPPQIRHFEVSDEFSSAGAYHHLRFESGYEPHPSEPGRERWLGYRENKTAHAWLLQHKGEQRPWLVCVPGYRMGSPVMDMVGFKARWLHEELGLNVAIPVMPLHGPRSMGRRGGDGFLSGDFVDTVHAHAQSVWDTRRLIGWLRGCGAPAVGAYGVSLGGYTASLLAGVEDDLACVIAGVPVSDFVGLIRSHMPDLATRFAERMRFPFDDLERLLRVVSPLALAPRVEHARRFIYAGTVDSVAVPSQARDLWEHWQRPRLEWYQGSHVSFLWEERVKSLVEEALATSGLVSQPDRSK